MPNVNAQGVFKQTRIKRQTARGVTATAAAGGQIMRRETSVFEMQKDTFTTESEITSTQQITANRHGAKQIAGKLTGLLSPGTYSDPLGALLRRDFAAVTAVTGASITVAGAGPTYTITRAAGSWLTDGFKVGMVTRLTAGAFNAANLNKNLFIVGATALVLSVLTLDGSSLVAEGPIAAATASIPGKVTYTPVTGQTVTYYTVEEWMPDAGVSELNTDVKFTQAALSLPGTGNAKIDFTAMGLNQTSGVAAYFQAPTVETTTSPCVAASGALLVNGVAQATVTDLSFTIDGSGAMANAVVGTTVRPDVFSGKVKVSGQFTAYFQDSTFHTAFLNESVLSILSALAADSSANADFITFAMSSVNINSSTPEDVETGFKRTYKFQAELNAAGGAGTATEKTTLQIHDSQAT
jgi:hypothetical protein